MRRRLIVGGVFAAAVAVTGTALGIQAHPVSPASATDAAFSFKIPAASAPAIPKPAPRAPVVPVVHIATAPKPVAPAPAVHHYVAPAPAPAPARVAPAPTGCALSIPAVGLCTGLGTMPGGSYMRPPNGGAFNVSGFPGLILGHNWGVFSAIQGGVPVGSTITVSGQTFRVTESFVAPNESSQMWDAIESGGITLVTCDGSQRRIVHAVGA